MSVQTQKNVMNVMVGKEFDNAAIAVASLQITDPTANSTYIEDGAIVALGLGSAGEVILPASSTNTIANYPSIRLVQRVGSLLNFSPRIQGVDVTKFTGVDGVAGNEQVTTVGYNGSTGAIDNSGTDFILTYVGLWDDMMWSKQQYRKAYDYYSTAATQQSIVKQLSFDINNDGFKQTMAGTGPQIKCEVLCDGTAADPSGSATTAAVVNGSDIVTLDAADSSVQAIGTIVRLGTAGGGRGTSVPVYIVVGIPSTDGTLSATQFRIHTYFQGTSDTALAIATALQAGGVVATATNYGLKFTGLPLTWVKDFWKYKRVQFRIEVKGFGTTTVSTPTTVSIGKGDYRTVAEMESFAAGNEGALNRTIVPLPTGRQVTPTNGSIPLYDAIMIEWADKSKKSPIVGTVPMQEQLFVYTPDSTNGARNSTRLLDQLNEWMVSAGQVAQSV